jgi:hypothetical protein
VACGERPVTAGLDTPMTRGGVVAVDGAVVVGGVVVDGTGVLAARTGAEMAVGRLEAASDTAGCRGDLACVDLAFFASPLGTRDGDESSGVFCSVPGVPLVPGFPLTPTVSSVFPWFSCR